jgi:hypothetical protein
MQMGRRSAYARLWLGALACAGITGAHWLAYVLTHGAHSHQQGALASTGHAYWPYFAALAMAALVAALARPLMQGFQAEPDDGQPRLGSMAVSLALMQMGGFFLLEIGERMIFAPGQSLNVLHEPVVLWGLLLQVVTAVAASLVVRLLVRIGQFVARVHRRILETGSAEVAWFITQISAPAPVPASGGPSLRAPPLVG